ncbi:unnamed protein product [Prunus armeniaca]
MGISSYKWAFGTKWYKHGIERTDELVGKKRDKPVEAELDEIFIFSRTRRGVFTDLRVRGVTSRGLLPPRREGIGRSNRKGKG